MRLLLLFTILASSSCAKWDPRTAHGVDPEFAPYVKMYLQFKGGPLAYDIPIQFGKIDSLKAGICTSWVDGYRQITINRSFWKTATQNQKVGLVFHELGHCDLNKKHNNSRYADGWPTSIMYTYAFDYPSSLAGYYYRQLFNAQQQRIDNLPVTNQ